MEATEVIRQNKTKLQHILVSDILFIIQCVFEEELLVHFEYINLKSIPLPFDAATALVDKMIFKGETICKEFLRLLRDTKLTDVFPDLKTMPWYNPPSSFEEQIKLLCCEHLTENKLFCEDEQKAVCHICDSCHHRGHKWLPIEQAVNQLKDQLKTDLETLKDKMDKYEDIKKKYNIVVRHNKKQAEATEKQIRAEFEKLHQFLKEEEVVRLIALREDKEQKGKILPSFLEQMSSLSDSISAVEQELQKHSVSFLSSYKHTQVSARVHFILPDPQVVSGALIDVTKHLGNLGFRVWEKMKERVKFTPVILDPNTANPCLRLSEDLTSVRWDTWHQLPENPERCIHLGVLGSKSFGSGKHSWEVDVGDHSDWKIGVARESYDRKNARDTPENGCWCLGHSRCRSGIQVFQTYQIGDRESIPVQRSPERIRVQLDYDRGELSFYDGERMTLIYTYEDTFTEKLYPYFFCGLVRYAETTDIRVCQI